MVLPPLTAMRAKEEPQQANSGISDILIYDENVKYPNRYGGTVAQRSIVHLTPSQKLRNRDVRAVAQPLAVFDTHCKKWVARTCGPLIIGAHSTSPKLPASTICSRDKSAVMDQDVRKPSYIIARTVEGFGGD